MSSVVGSTPWAMTTLPAGAVAADPAPVKIRIAPTRTANRPLHAIAASLRVVEPDKAPSPLTLGARPAKCQATGHWVNLLRQIHSALASRPSRSARTATLRAGRQPSTYVQFSPRLVGALLSSNGHVRLGLPARS